MAQLPVAVSKTLAGPVPGLWADAEPPPNVLGSSAALLPGIAGIPQIPGVSQTSMSGSELPQLPPWPNLPGQAMLGGQLGQQQAYSLYPGSLDTSLALSMGMPGLGAPGLGPPGQGAFSYAGSYGQLGTSNGGESAVSLSAQCRAGIMKVLLIIGSELFEMALLLRCQ